MAEITWQAMLDVHDPRTTLLYPFSEAICTISKTSGMSQSTSLSPMLVVEISRSEPFARTTFVDAAKDLLFQWNH